MMRRQTMGGPWGQTISRRRQTMDADQDADQIRVRIIAPLLLAFLRESFVWSLVILDLSSHDRWCRPVATIVSFP